MFVGLEGGRYATTLLSTDAAMHFTRSDSRILQESVQVDEDDARLQENMTTTTVLQSKRTW